LARVSIVDYDGCVLMDKYVIPDGKTISDYRTWVSGITKESLRPENGAIPQRQAILEAHQILKNKIIVGHSIHHDLVALNLCNIRRQVVRDVREYHEKNSHWLSSMSLKVMSTEMLGIEIQSGSHDSVIDARASLALYRIVEREWENRLSYENDSY
jgi:RNA exonuclease 4